MIQLLLQQLLPQAILLIMIMSIMIVCFHPYSFWQIHHLAPHVQISCAHTYSKTLHRGIFRSVKKSVSLLQTMVMFAISSSYFFMFQLTPCLSLTGCVQTTRLNTDGVPYIHNISPLLYVNINAYYWQKKNDSYCLSAIDLM